MPSAECRCKPFGDWGTCGYCLRNAKPYLFTPTPVSQMFWAYMERCKKEEEDDRKKSQIPVRP